MSNKSNFIDHKFTTSEQDKASIFKKGEAKNMLIGGRDSGNVFLLSLNEQLRNDIAIHLAKKLNKNLQVLKRNDGLPALTTTAQNDDQIISVPRAATNSTKTQNLLKDNGKVICIMSDFQTLLNATDRSDEAKQELTTYINRFEPNFIKTAHHIVRSDQSFDEMIEDICLKIKL